MMVHCRMIEPRTFYQATEQILIDAPFDGIVYSDHKDITIVPQVVHSGENRVVAIRNTKLVTVEEGVVVGIVMPFPEEPEEVVPPAEPPIDPPAEEPAEVSQAPAEAVLPAEESSAEVSPAAEPPAVEAPPKVVEQPKSPKNKSK
ncbi:conserved hypothetical protein [uncultured Sporomusa sp.]|uniref:Uncharacterized protein n=1 Tax=uncultured Sporomusa sp. TaxID=307249 RepID=A0A212LXY7_9FIRM|nr:hypothetical protein [uncultured Sporomusa sp.]SCM82398.1 conserved hypothetical protein [uncultured Sporomusa sp.]